MNVYETREVFEYLEKRNLIKQYKKAKSYMLNWLYENINFKLRKPKSDKVYYFRINKQFRAFWKFDDYWDFIVWEINNHQD